MNCPKCGKPMESGTMYAGKYPLWTQRKKPPLFRAPKDRVILRPLGDTSVGDFAFPFHNYPDTMLCRACNIACFSFQLPSERLSAARPGYPLRLCGIPAYLCAACQLALFAYE